MSASVEMNIVEEIVALKARVAELEAAAKPAAKAEAAEEAKPKAAKAKAPASEKPKKEKKEKTEVSLPSAEDGEPDESAYRVAEADIDHSTCIARVLPPSAGYVDKRWSKHISREKQCGKKVEDGADLCESCTAKEEAYAEEASTKAGWKGRIGEEPLDWLHMLGTKWATDLMEKGKLTFNGSGASDSASVAESEKSEKSEKPKAAEKAAAAAAKKAEVAAKKAEAEKAKEAKKEAVAAKKEAAEKAKEAKKEAAEAKKATKASKPEKPEGKAKKEAKVAKVAEPTEVEFELKVIGDTVYAIKNGNVYEWDGDAEKRGDCVGRLTGDAEDPSIDTDAAEVV
jgi:hypothetical protein